MGLAFIRWSNWHLLMSWYRLTCLKFHWFLGVRKRTGYIRMSKARVLRTAKTLWSRFWITLKAWMYVCWAVVCWYSLVTGRCPVQGVLPNCLKGFRISELNSELKQARQHNPWSACKISHHLRRYICHGVKLATHPSSSVEVKNVFIK